MTDFMSFSLWQLLDQALGRDRRPGSPSVYRSRLRKLLKFLDGVELARFIHELAHLLDALRSEAQWAAASLRLRRLADDDEFAHLRNWVIAHGQAAFAAFLDDPDALATIDPDQTSPFMAPLSATPLKLYGTLAARDPQLDDRVDQALADIRFDGEWDLHIGWSFWTPPSAATLQRDFPRLWQRHGAQWQPGRSDSLAATPGLTGFLKQAKIDGLGLVSCGDRISIDGADVEILGISDMQALLAGDDELGDEPLFSDDSRYVARVREADGSTRCNQLISAEFLQRSGPSQFRVREQAPEGGEGSAVEDDQEQLAWEAADEAIQQRLREALQSEPEVRVQFAAYDEDDDGLPIDNLDSIAHSGSVQFQQIDEADGECHSSEILTNPTWLDVARAANAMMLALNYHHHVYLEGINVTPRKGQPDLGEFLLGS